MSDPELARCNVRLSHKRQRDPSNKIHREIEHRRRLIPVRFLFCANSFCTDLYHCFGGRARDPLCNRIFSIRCGHCRLADFIL
jgi:hypothetical protein